ncbi:hypothetical protein TIFTF001_036696 [Ficus carica]|uniref:Uncharacterized protein n=1 Tax=Ficus carica TaxID=3494 RepID=A0AA88E4S6_FICCA|nr:hypothetical protein TIFTF001_036696 [Ficus carica]
MTHSSLDAWTRTRTTCICGSMQWANGCLFGRTTIKCRPGACLPPVQKGLRMDTGTVHGVPELGED